MDVCRAVAAAMFGDASRVRYVATTLQNRLPMLQSGEIDILASNTTWTLTREASLGLQFTGVTFYDGQGFLVRRSALPPPANSTARRFESSRVRRRS